MRRNIKIYFSDGDEIDGSVNIRNTDHILACRKYRSIYTKNKKRIIERKQKYKNKLIGDSDGD